METSPETRYSLGAVFSAIFQVRPPSSEVATLALICQATAICCGFLGFTAIEGSLKYPGLGVMSTTCALGAGASCWAKTEEANNRIVRQARRFINEETFYSRVSRLTSWAKLRVISVGLAPCDRKVRRLSASCRFASRRLCSSRKSGQ